MLLLQIAEWENIESCKEYLFGKNLANDESKPFDQYKNLCTFVNKCNSL